MGASLSLDLRPEEVREIEDATNFEPKEIKTLYKRFRRLDRSGRGTLSSEDLLMIPEISMNPLASRLTTIFDRDIEDRINFRSFTAGLSVFAGRAKPEAKCKAVFRLYDIDGDGFITAKDMRELCDLMVGKTLSSATVDAIVTRTLAAADKDADGRVSMHDFAKCMSSVSWDLLSLPVKSSHRWEAQETLHTSVSFTRPPLAVDH